MKTFWMILLLAFTTSALAQEEPIPPRRASMAKVGLFGGFTPGWLSVDTKPLNSYLVSAGAAPLSENGVFLYGGGGAIYIMVLPNVRVGGLGMGGSLSSSNVVGGVRKDAELHVGFGGVTIEYVIPILPRLDFAFGTMIGRGGIDVTLRQDVGGAKTWQEEWNNFASGNYQTQVPGQVNNIQRTMNGTFLVLVPSVSFEYAVLGWLGVRLGASYVGMVAPSWSLDSDYDLISVPSSITGKGLMINAGVFLGTY